MERRCQRVGMMVRDIQDRLATLLGVAAAKKRIQRGERLRLKQALQETAVIVPVSLALARARSYRPPMANSHTKTHIRVSAPRVIAVLK
jgi:hypothetical protein